MSRVTDDVCPALPVGDADRQVDSHPSPIMWPTVSCIIPEIRLGQLLEVLMGATGLTEAKDCGTHELASV